MDKVIELFKSKKIPVFKPEGTKEDEEEEYKRFIATPNLLYRFSRPDFVVQPENASHVQAIIKLEGVQSGDETYVFERSKDRTHHQSFTVASAIYTAWGLTLARATGQHGVLFGTVFSGRDSPVPGIARIDGPVFTLTPQKVIVDPVQTLRELTAAVYNAQWNVMAHAQWRMKQFLQAGPRAPVPFDTMVNIPVADHGEDDLIAKQLFKREGERPAWETAYTSLDLMEEDGKFTLAIVTKLDEGKAKELMHSVVEAVKSILEDPNGMVQDLL
ncbi:hypothetical protein AOQ84DRAFT_222205 [Glonium stellatum]|uniref:Condensation domain-containing protein n=1 Tax=Glonium stellatum TaxID=574774 RepID=A0A8E2F048_9PEZI|nr:hypothetical protein AOQ84DRAFT_222205 [Glonium stellatum]